MGDHANDAFDEVLKYMDWSEKCRDLGVDPNQEDAADVDEALGKGMKRVAPG